VSALIRAGLKDSIKQRGFAKSTPQSFALCLPSYTEVAQVSFFSQHPNILTHIYTRGSRVAAERKVRPMASPLFYVFDPLSCSSFFFVRPAC
jgi:hypothetical protein